MQNKAHFSIPLPSGMELIEDGRLSQDNICNMLKDVKGFEVFEHADLVFLVQHMKAYRALAGTTIFRERDTNSYLSVLIEGRVGVYKEDSSDAVKFLAAISPGRIFGEISVIDKLPYSASIVAESEAIIVTMSRESFCQCIEARPTVGVRLLCLVADLLCARLRSVSNQLVDYMDV